MTEIDLEKILAETVETADDQLVIKMPNSKLPVGQHRFSLTVEDNAGNTSQPAIISVIVVDDQAPTAVVDLSDEQGRNVTNGRIAFGRGFILSGKRSTDIGGTIAKYSWEVVAQ